ncbi:magnesium transporter [Brumimicrobium oceani]|uniref:Magnesium transporter MgtE n=1 Tax=Brumimicrobium oceani TaxID=2100725 RepID=A0A2U2XAL9_9FLAO|nr:magnesium transporter [Brumimicrobium oceani]PWH84838.1 magnesium transporter [Brumimicrobium oceani]
MQFELTREYLDEIRDWIAENQSNFINDTIIHLHPADIAEILDELNTEEAKFVYAHLDHDLQGDVLMELEDDVRQKFVETFNSDQLALQLENLDSDDAVDILGEMSIDKQLEVISKMDSENASELVDLLNYDENTAGGLMQTEFIRAKLEWPINRCVIELRRQAEEVDKVHTIYVVDNDDVLVGTLSLKSLLVANSKAIVRDVYENKNMAYVFTNEDSEEVARVMDKYDLVSVPVLNLQKKLVGRITIDDIVDVIREEADKDFQMASGISENVEHDAGILKMSRARLPWLMIGLLGGVLGSQVIGNFEMQIGAIPSLAFFIPLVAAMGGNVGVQSSAIVVQSIANGTSQFSSILSRVRREALLGLLNGLICGTFIFGITWLLQDIKLGISVSIALFIVIFFAAIFGTLIPLILHKYKIDPAVATGPFITTLNDVVGLFIYFGVGMMVFGL